MNTYELIERAVELWNRVSADRQDSSAPRATRVVGRPARRLCLCEAALGMWLAAFAFTANGQGMPPHVQADLLKQKVFAAMKAGDTAAILSSIAELDRMGDTMVPPALRIPEAKAAEQSGDPVRAVAALEKYFSAVQRDDSRYSEALSMYGRLIEMPEVQAARDARESAAARQAQAATADAIRRQIKAEDAALAERKKACASIESEFEARRDAWLKCHDRPKIPFGVPCKAEDQAYNEAARRSLSCTKEDEYWSRREKLEASLREATSSTTD